MSHPESDAFNQPEPVPMSFSDRSKVQELLRDVEEIQSPLLMLMGVNEPPVIVLYQPWDIMPSREFDGEIGYGSRY
jgi:hypothetical protein